VIPLVLIVVLAYFLLLPLVNVWPAWVTYANRSQSETTERVHLDDADGT
jgi:hypothetical protein